jgi:transcriptional regulator with PAS, ATPase and Fis domain
MKKEYKGLNIHQKIELLIEDMVDNELSLQEALREFKKIYIEKTSLKYKGNKTKMAKALGLHRNTLNHQIKSLKLK